MFKVSNSPNLQHIQTEAMTIWSGIIGSVCPKCMRPISVLFLQYNIDRSHLQEAKCKH